MKKYLIFGFLTIFIATVSFADFLEDYPGDSDPVVAPQLRENMNQLWQFSKKMFNPYSTIGMTVKYKGGKACFGNNVYDLEEDSIDFSSYTGISTHYVSIVPSGGAASLLVEAGSYNSAGIPLWRVSTDGLGGITLSDDRTLVRNGMSVPTTTSGILKSSSGVISAAVAGTDYQEPLTFINSIQNNFNNVSLTGDSASPGSSMLYGTDASGNKGWYSQPTGTPEQSILIMDQKPSGTAGGTIPNGIWTTRILNTIVKDDTRSVVLNNNTSVSVPAGTWCYRIKAPAYNCTNHRARLVFSNGSTIYGTTEYSLNGNGIQTSSFIIGKFSSEVTNRMKIQHRCSAPPANANALGMAFGNLGVPETYTTFELWQPASGSVVGGVSSFNGRTGAISPASGDYTAAQVGAVPASAVGAPSGVATLDNNSLVVQNPSSATSTPTANAIPIAGPDGTLNNWVTIAGSSGRLLSRTILTSGTSYTTPAGCYKIYVQLVGGGGGGGGASGAASSSAAGGGGGAGGYADKIFDVSPNTAYSYTIGAGGDGGASSGGAGTGGGSTTFTVDGVTITAYGGAGGGGMTAGTSAALCSAGNGGGGDNLYPDVASYGVGGGGLQGIRFSGTLSLSGFGGSSRFSAGAKGSATNNNGSSANNYGGGGAGANTMNGTSYSGGNGAPGVIIVWEYSN